MNEPGYSNCQHHNNIDCQEFIKKIFLACRKYLGYSKQQLGVESFFGLGKEVINHLQKKPNRFIQDNHCNNFYKILLAKGYYFDNIKLDFVRDTTIPSEEKLNMLHRRYLFIYKFTNDLTKEIEYDYFAVRIELPNNVTVRFNTEKHGKLLIEPNDESIIYFNLSVLENEKNPSAYELIILKLRRNNIENNKYSVLECMGLWQLKGDIKCRKAIGFNLSDDLIFPSDVNELKILYQELADKILNEQNNKTKVESFFKNENKDTFEMLIINGYNNEH